MARVGDSELLESVRSFVAHELERTRGTALTLTFSRFKRWCRSRGMGELPGRARSQGRFWRYLAEVVEEMGLEVLEVKYRRRGGGRRDLLKVVVELPRRGEAEEE